MPNPDYRKYYVPVRYKLVVAAIVAIAWLGFSVYVALPWIDDLSHKITPVLAWLVVGGIAFIPGFSNAFLLAGLMLDRRPIYSRMDEFPAVSVLIAAYNEENYIGMTLHTLLTQTYDGPVEIIVIDDGSRDKTATIVEDVLASIQGTRNHMQLRLLRMPKNSGKSQALNTGLKVASYDWIVTVDADTYMRQGSLAALVRNIVDGPARTAAVAGTVLVRNSRKNFITRLQEWDYFHGIAVVKRIQSLLQGTLVAQGAFSIYRRSVLEELGGWSNVLGEDIVLTWGMLTKGYRVGYAENAFVFTNVPETYQQFYLQRRRWSRGLIEAFKRYPGILFQPRVNLPFIYLNLLFPYLDSVYLLGFLPGVIAAVFFHNYAVVGILTLVLIPLAVLVNIFMYLQQGSIFQRYGLKVRKNILGLLCYMIIYQLLMSPASVMGYFAEFFNLRKKWDTK